MISISRIFFFRTAKTFNVKNSVHRYIQIDVNTCGDSTIYFIRIFNGLYKRINVGADVSSSQPRVRRYISAYELRATRRVFSFLIEHKSSLNTFKSSIAFLRHQLSRRIFNASRDASPIKVTHAAYESREASGPPYIESRACRSLVVCIIAIVEMPGVRCARCVTAFREKHVRADRRKRRTEIGPEIEWRRARERVSENEKLNKSLSC